jgi:hypothetical protein
VRGVDDVDIEVDPETVQSLLAQPIERASRHGGRALSLKRAARGDGHAALRQLLERGVVVAHADDDGVARCDERPRP